MNELLYCRLLEVAKAHCTITYREVAELVGLGLGKAEHRADLSKILRTISLHEQEHGRPLLSAVVVSEATDFPGRGFFWMLESLGVSVSDNQEELFERELGRVHQHWAYAVSSP